MKIIAEAISEQEVLAAVAESARAESIVERMVTRSECCVDHLCGCT